jgi:hypothetical protein
MNRYFQQFAALPRAVAGAGPPPVIPGVHFPEAGLKAVEHQLSKSARSSYLGTPHSSS